MGDTTELGCLRVSIRVQTPAVLLSFPSLAGTSTQLLEFGCGAELHDGSVVLPRGEARMLTRAESIVTEDGIPAQESVLEYESTVPGILLRQYVRAFSEGEWLEVAMELVNTKDVPIRVRELHPLHAASDALLGSTTGVRWLQMAYCSANTHSPVSRSGIVDSERRPGPLDSWWMTAVFSPEDNVGLVLGFVTFHRFAGRFRGMQTEPLRAINYCGDLEVRPAEALRSEGVMVSAAQDPHVPLGCYARRAATLMRARPVAAPVCGWSSWGHYLEAIDGQTIVDNARALEWRSDSFWAVRIVSIDEGWAEKLGVRRPDSTWQPGRQFRMEIPEVAAAIRATGRDVGLWLAPFVVNDGSRLAREHPEWLVQDSAGRPFRHAIGKGVYVLDPTHPGANRYLTDLIRRVTCDWGMRYLKLDFLRGIVSPEPDHPEHGILVPRCFYDGSTSVEAYRTGLDVIRRAAAPGTHVLACGDPLGPTIGFANSRRIGHDISPFWGDEQNGIVASSRNVAANYFWCGATWRNDPDFVLVDGEPNEARVWATLVALAGGDVMISADMNDLVGWQEELLRKIIPPMGLVARPLDLFESDPPAVWHLPISAAGTSWDVVACINWGMHAREFDLPWRKLNGAPGSSYDVFEYWTQSDRGCPSEALRTTVQGRTVELFAIRRAASVPRIIGTDGHFTQGAVEIQSSTWDPKDAAFTLRISPQQDRALTITFRVPESFSPVRTRLGGHVVAEEWIEAGRTWRVTFGQRAAGQTQRLQFTSKEWRQAGVRRS